MRATVSFRSPRALTGLRSWAVASTLAAFTATMSVLFSDGNAAAGRATLTVGLGVVSLAMGLLWTGLLPSRPRAAWSVGVVFIGAEVLAWVLWEMASVPPWSGMSLLAKLSWVGFFSGFCFFPLLAMLALFGAPVAWAQRQERRGLVFADRGARVVGSICAGISLTLLVILGGLGRIPLLSDGPVPEVLSEWFLVALTLSGLASSAGVVGLTALRSRRRGQLVAAVEAGAVTPYRIELRPAGRVLVRVRPAGHGHYRQADEPEELVLLEEAASEAKRPERR